MSHRSLIIGIAIVFTCVGPCQAQIWLKTLIKELPRFGHRNWIVIADSAYPAQTAPGIETIVTDEHQLAVVKAVLESCSTRHPMSA